MAIRTLYVTERRGFLRRGTKTLVSCPDSVTFGLWRGSLSPTKRSRLPLAPFHTTPPNVNNTPHPPPQLVLFSVRHRLLLSSSFRFLSCTLNVYLTENSCSNRNSVVGFFHRYGILDYPPFTTNPKRPSFSINTLWVTRQGTPTEKTLLKHTIWIPKWKMSGNPHRPPP